MLSTAGVQLRATLLADGAVAETFFGGNGGVVSGIERVLASTSSTATSYVRELEWSPSWKMPIGVVPSASVPLSAGSATPSSQTSTLLEVSFTTVWTWSSCQTPGLTPFGLVLLIPVTSSR